MHKETFRHTHCISTNQLSSKAVKRNVMATGHWEF